MVRTNHGSLPTAALNGGLPSPYPYVAGDLYFLPKIWSKSVVHGPDLFEDALNSLTPKSVPAGTKTPCLEGFWLAKHNDTGAGFLSSCMVLMDKRTPPPGAYVEGVG